MPNNHLKLLFNTTGDKSGRVHAYVSVLIDGQSLTEETIDPIILLKSYRKGISDFLITCDCGHAGCAGVYSECAIVQGDWRVLWIIPEPQTTSPMAENEPDNAHHKLYYFTVENYESEMIALATAFEEFNSNE